MREISLSYVLTTFNKLDYLKITLPYLIQACQSDEEIVVVDGGSTDGSAEFLLDLHKNQKIHRYVSEKDHGEAHGTNKAMLLAGGLLIKIITDDDVFDFKSIQRCKQFMLQHPQTDVLCSDGFSCKLGNRVTFESTHFIDGFYSWRKKHTPFLFCGLSLLIRKSSLTYLGLFDTKFKIVDMEYSLRISALNCRMAFYTGPVFVNIVNPASNSVKFYEMIRKEFTRLRRAYPEAHLNFKINNPILRMKERLSRILIRSGNSKMPNTITLLEQFKHTVYEGQRMFSGLDEKTFQFLESE